MKTYALGDVLRGEKSVVFGRLAVTYQELTSALSRGVSSVAKTAVTYEELTSALSSLALEQLFDLQTEVNGLIAQLAAEYDYFPELFRKYLKGVDDESLLQKFKPRVLCDRRFTEAGLSAFGWDTQRELEEELVQRGLAEKQPEPQDLSEIGL
jgi:hypothetical protein